MANGRLLFQALNLRDIKQTLAREVYKTNKQTNKQIGCPLEQIKITSLIKEHLLVRKKALTIFSCESFQTVRWLPSW